MSINLRTGQPGHGKSYGAVRCIRDSLERGEWVATNMPLVEGWAVTMARTNWARRLVPGRCDRKAADFRSRLYFVEDLSELRRLSLPACGKCRGCKDGPGCQAEGRGRAVLDEAHQWLNSRTWDADETGQAQTKAEAVRRRLDIIKFFATHRHRGWHIELITQDDANLDRQVRTLFETHTHLKNLRRFKLLGILPVVPVNVFVAVTHWHDNEKTRLGVETYLLNKRLARCYDTFGAARQLERDPDAIELAAAIGRQAGGAAKPAPAAGHPLTSPALGAPRGSSEARDPDCAPESAQRPGGGAQRRLRRRHTAVTAVARERASWGLSRLVLARLRFPLSLPAVPAVRPRRSRAGDLGASNSRSRFKTETRWVAGSVGLIALVEVAHGLGVI